MASVSDNYVKMLYKRYRHFAAWLPNTNVQLGDVGFIRGMYFKRISTLKLLGVDFTMRVGKKPLVFNDDLTAGLEMRAKAAGEIAVGTTLPVAEAGVSIDFADKGAFVFHAVNCYADEIENKEGLGKKLIALGNKWDLGWAVVDTIVRAGSATILVANEGKSRIELTAKSDVVVSNLAKPGLGLEVASKNGDVTQFLAEKGLTPLFRLSWFHHSWTEWLLGQRKQLYFGGEISRGRQPKVPILQEVTLDLQEIET